MAGVARQLFCATALIGVIGVAQAQGATTAPQVENVTVIGTRDRQRIEKFIESFAAPTTLLGKLARWKTGICPVAVGLRPAAIKFILDRMRNIATEVGAPVNTNSKCKANIEIVFTTSPQKLLDNVRKEHSIYLGYASNSRQADKLATVIHPIQAWYTTQSRDLMGLPKVDSSRTIGLGDSGEFAAAMMMGNTTGLRMRDGRSSELYNIIIAIDPNRLADNEIGGIADYISFLSLSRLASLDQCQQLPSIMDMLVPGCPAVAEMTSYDMGFLRGLYKMTSDGNLRMQKDGIVAEMAKTLRGD